MSARCLHLRQPTLSLHRTKAAASVSATIHACQTWKGVGRPLPNAAVYRLRACHARKSIAVPGKRRIALKRRGFEPRVAECLGAKLTGTRRQKKRGCKEYFELA